MMEFSSKHYNLIDIIEKDFKIDFYGIHGIGHWKRVFKNTLILSDYYNVKSDVFELFALLHDSKREDDLIDIEHGYRASIFVQKLLNEQIITLNDEDAQKLIYACKNHTKTDTTDPLYSDIVVKICFDSDRLDIGRVGVVPNPSYMATDYAKSLL